MLPGVDEAGATETHSFPGQMAPMTWPYSENRNPSAVTCAKSPPSLRQ